MIGQTSTTPLTPKEKTVLEFLENYIGENEVAPTFQEIRDHFGFASYNSVQRYLKQLSSKGYIKTPQGNQKRAITLLQSSKALVQEVTELQNRPNQGGKTLYFKPRLDKETLTLPLLGKVAAGEPIESVEHDEFIDVPPSFVRNADRTFALKVQGDSMIDDGIFDGDIILVQQQSDANNGEIVVAMTESEATVKRYFNHTRKLREIRDIEGDEHSGRTIELRPSNATMQPMWFYGHQIEIMGIVVGLMRKFS